ncbi:MAG TPA: TonB-dependent receptor plug domain-containing protein, partial [Steroidobacteraceae bacterium]|nr:TonB-dependent receptor plug domain-containing protein [Steroidobacteraceae bacterium]
MTLALLCLGLILAMPAPAQDTGGATLEEITVTAQRREQNLQDVGTSITAFGAKDMQNLGLTDVTDIAAQTPGLQFNQYGATITVYNLRGVS